MINKKLNSVADRHIGASVDLMLWMGGHQHRKRSLNSIKKLLLMKRLFVMM